MSRILITGATGFLGSTLVRELQAQSAVLRTTARQPGQDHLPDYQTWDLANDPIPGGLLEDVSCIVHCAGLAHQFHASTTNASQFQQVNCEATETLARAAAENGVRRFVFVSSVSVYGPADKPRMRNEDHPPCPVGEYAISKRNAELRLLAIAEKTGMQVLILRMATLYGPDDPGNMGRLREAIKRGRFLMIGRGTNQKSLLHVDDAAHACVLAALEPFPLPLGIWNIAATPCSMNAIVTELSTSLGHKQPKWFVPAFVACGLLETASVLGVGPIRRIAKVRLQTLNKWLADDAYDGTRFAQEFSWHPRVSLKKGVETMSQAAPFPVGIKTQEGSKMKRAFDIVAACYLLVLFALPMALIALAVKLSSRGPVLYWSDRVGRGNRIFRMPKFRSMRTNTPELATHLLSDSRHWITPLGHFLRKTSLDELPQLWCILKGEMSFVGPRPALFNQDDLISLRTEKGIHHLMPGLTGWAQINGRDELPIPEKVALDEAYLHQQSFQWDLKILFLTALKVVKREGVTQTGDPEKTQSRRAA